MRPPAYDDHQCPPARGVRNHHVTRSDMAKQPGDQDDKARWSALDAASAPDADGGLMHGLVVRILAVGLDGIGPLDSAREIAEQALADAEGDVERAVTKVARQHLVGGTVGGFVTGLGGFITMPVALPANVLEFSVQAARMVGSIAVLRGYDIDDRRIRAAIALTLVGSDADDILKKAGMGSGIGQVSDLALKRMPASAMLMVNKAIGFRLVRGVGTKAFSRLGRGIPVAGGVVGGAIDAYMMKKIGDAALQEFPAVTT